MDIVSEEIGAIAGSHWHVVGSGDQDILARPKLGSVLVRRQVAQVQRQKGLCMPAADNVGKGKVTQPTSLS